MTTAVTHTAADVAELSFSQVVGLVNEPNMCSGGSATIRTVLREAPGVGPGSRILEVGSNTGFSVLEMAAASRADVFGIDIEDASVRFAKAKAKALALTNAYFSVGDGTRIDFPDGHFDLVFASNVTSFIPDRTAAISEYYRVLRPFGVLAAVPIFYRERPPAELLRAVEVAVGAPMPGFSREDWKEMFGRAGSELIFSADHRYDDLDEVRIDAYVVEVLAQPCNDGLAPDVREAATERLRYFYRLFNRNLQYAGYAIFLYRKSSPTAFPVLHTSTPIAGSVVRR